MDVYKAFSTKDVKHRHDILILHENKIIRYFLFA